MRTICTASLLGVWLFAVGGLLTAQEQKQPTGDGDRRDVAHTGLLGEAL